MAYELSDYLLTRMISHAFKLETWTPSSTLVLDLYTAAPSGQDASGGTLASGNGYAAKTIANDGSLFEAGVAGEVLLAENVTFGTPSGGGWGNLVACRAKDGAGNVWGWADLTSSPIATSDGVPVILGAGAVAFRLISPPA